ncbi:MAG TPA: ABC transporter substrate-binding protein [Novosphingobium sp.]|nr:ABC transporter substrate-binding protein [Novosphingobium sp.]
MAALAVALSLWLARGGPAPSVHKRFVLQLSWRAQPEVGGYVEAGARGYYQACGLDVELRQGGAGIDPAQLLVAGAVDAALLPQADGIIHMNAAGFPARALFAAMQHSAMALDVHADSPIRAIPDMVGHPIMLSASSRASWWPFLKRRFGFADAQLRNFTGQFAPFVADPDAVTQDMISNGPYQLETKSHLQVRTFSLAPWGYDPYGAILTVSQQTITRDPAAMRCLVSASQRGWQSYLADPGHAYGAIHAMSPEYTDGASRYAYKVLMENHIFSTPETDRQGLGIMSAARWRAHYALLRDLGVAPAGLDPDSLFTNAFLPGAAPAPHS